MRHLGATSLVAIDRATRWIFMQVKPNKTAGAGRAFLSALQKAAPCHVRTIQADNGSEFTGQLFNKQKHASDEHEFALLCDAFRIEHRLTKPRSPQTNGMVERFNGRISDVLATHRFEPGNDPPETLERYALLYNQHLPQLAPGTDSNHERLAAEKFILAETNLLIRIVEFIFY